MPQPSAGRSHLDAYAWKQWYDGHLRWWGTEHNDKAAMARLTSTCARANPRDSRTFDREKPHTCMRRTQPAGSRHNRRTNVMADCSHGLWRQRSLNTPLTRSPYYINLFQTEHLKSTMSRCPLATIEKKAWTNSKQPLGHPHRLSVLFWSLCFSLILAVSLGSPAPPSLC